MRWLPLLLVGGVAVAAPSKPVRKPAPAELSTEKLSYFVDAVMADKAGDYEKAISRYRSAADGKDLAAIVYNIADLERRTEDYEAALKGYKKYLELAPQAPDRGEVLQLIAQLEKTPASIVIDGEDLDGIVFIDGKRAGASPMVTTLTTGWHIIDRIGSESFFHDDIEAKPMMQKHVQAYAREDKGNVVLSTSANYGGSWRDKGIHFQMNQRFELPPGKYETYFFDPGRGCSNIAFTVPNTGLVYVYIEAPRERPKRDACVPIKVTSQIIGGVK